MFSSTQNRADSLSASSQDKTILTDDSDEALGGASVLVRNNLDPNAQIKRDIEMVSGAIENPGSDSFSAEILKKIYTLFLMGGVQVLNKETNKVEYLNLPIASAICHGARVLIQVPAGIDQELKEWLFAGKIKDGNIFEDLIREAATHGINCSGQEAKETETKEIEAKEIEAQKIIQEEKVKVHWAAIHAARIYLAWAASFVPFVGKSIANAVLPRGCHYGINLALGGEGNQHFSSNNQIANNGQHGHLYLFHMPSSENKPGGWLVGIEQSAPGEKDQYGGAHNLCATHHSLTATGGSDFAKSLQFKDIGPKHYYDGLFINLTKENFEKAKKEVRAFGLNWLWMTWKPKSWMQAGQKPAELKEIKKENPPEVRSPAECVEVDKNASLTELSQESLSIKEAPSVQLYFVSQTGVVQGNASEMVHVSTSSHYSMQVDFSLAQVAQMAATQPSTQQIENKPTIANELKEIKVELEPQPESLKITQSAAGQILQGNQQQPVGPLGQEISTGEIKEQQEDLAAARITITPPTSPSTSIPPAPLINPSTSLLASSTTEQKNDKDKLASVLKSRLLNSQLKQAGEGGSNNPNDTQPKNPPSKIPTWKKVLAITLFVVGLAALATGAAVLASGILASLGCILLMGGGGLLTIASGSYFVACLGDKGLDATTNGKQGPMVKKLPHQAREARDNSGSYQLTLSPVPEESQPSQLDSSHGSQNRP